MHPSPYLGGDVQPSRGRRQLSRKCGADEKEGPLSQNEAAPGLLSRPQSTRLLLKREVSRVGAGQRGPAGAFGPLSALATPRAVGMRTLGRGWSIDPDCAQWVVGKTKRDSAKQGPHEQRPVPKASERGAGAASQSGGSQGTSGPQGSCRGPRFNSVGDPAWGLHALRFSHGSLYPGQLLLPPASQGPHSRLFAGLGAALDWGVVAVERLPGRPRSRHHL